MGGARRPILVLDDDPEVVRLIARVLQHDGHAVVAMTDPRDALGTLERLTPSLVFADLMMPFLDGEAFVLKMRAMLGDEAPPVVLVTASVARREVAARVGAAATVEKPFEVEDIRDLAARFTGQPKSEPPPSF